MTLIKCAECDGDLSTDAKGCPHCGKPLQSKSRRPAAVLVVGLVVALAVAALSRNFASNTMPRSWYAGAAMACVQEQLPLALASAFSDEDIPSMECEPTWFNAAIRGFPRVDVGGGTLGGFGVSDREKAYLAAMKSDLRNLVTAQESYFVDNGRYATDLGSRYVASRGVRVTIIQADADGWAATASHASAAQTCRIEVGSAVSGDWEGEPICQ